MTLAQALADAGEALGVLKGAMPFITAVVPAAGPAVAAIDVIGATLPIAAKLDADINADVTAENANLATAHAAMVAAVAKVDAIANS